MRKLLIVDIDKERVYVIFSLFLSIIYHFWVEMFKLESDYLGFFEI